MTDEMRQNQAEQAPAEGNSRHLGFFSADNLPEGLTEAYQITPESLAEIQENQAKTYSQTQVQVGVKSGYVLRKVGEAYMVMPTGARMKEYRGMITLNETGAFLFKEAQKPEASRDKLVHAAMEEYKVGELEAAENVDSFIQQCAQCNLFEFFTQSVTVYRGDPAKVFEAGSEDASQTDGTNE